jgi:hypothetical protein
MEFMLCFAYVRVREWERRESTRACEPTRDKHRVNLSSEKSSEGICDGEDRQMTRQDTAKENDDTPPFEFSRSPK